MTSPERPDAGYRGEDEEPFVLPDAWNHISLTPEQLATKDPWDDDDSEPLVNWSIDPEQVERIRELLLSGRIHIDHPVEFEVGKIRHGDRVDSIMYSFADVIARHDHPAYDDAVKAHVEAGMAARRDEEDRAALWDLRDPRTNTATLEAREGIDMDEISRRAEELGWKEVGQTPGGGRVFVAPAMPSQRSGLTDFHEPRAEEPKSGPAVIDSDQAAGPDLPAGPVATRTETDPWNEEPA